jgi:diacylglycerol kinase family enzyme
VAIELAEILRTGGHHVEVEIHGGRNAVATVATLCKAKACDAVVVAGGDGTISAAAATAAESGIILGVIPLGTMNLFARSLGLPLGMKEAAEALATAEPARVDVGAVNGRFFAHHVTLGLHPRMIRVRERLRYGSRLGKILASIQAWWMVVRRPPRLSVRVRADSEAFSKRTAAILISNNPLGEGHLPYADDLEQGQLGLYIATSRRWRDLLELAARVTFGEIETPLLDRRLAKHVEISLNRPVINASIDGEIVSLEAPLHVKVHPRRLAVLRPRAIGSENASAETTTEPPGFARIA